MQTRAGALSGWLVKPADALVWIAERLDREKIPEPLNLFF
jgi:hypothetical protein